MYARFFNESERGLMARVGEQTAFPARSGRQPQAGEVWEVSDAGKSKSGKAVFLKCTRRVFANGEYYVTRRAADEGGLELSETERAPRSGYSWAIYANPNKGLAQEVEAALTATIEKVGRDPDKREDDKSGKFSILKWEWMREYDCGLRPQKCTFTLTVYAVKVLCGEPLNGVDWNGETDWDTLAAAYAASEKLLDSVQSAPEFAEYLSANFANPTVRRFRGSGGGGDLGTLEIRGDVGGCSYATVGIGYRGAGYRAASKLGPKFDLGF